MNITVGHPSRHVPDCKPSMQSEHQSESQGHGWHRSGACTKRSRICQHASKLCQPRMLVTCSGCSEHVRAHLISPLPARPELFRPRSSRARCQLTAGWRCLRLYLIATDAVAAPPRRAGFIASTSLYDAHILRGNVSGLMTARSDIDSASASVTRGASLRQHRLGRCAPSATRPTGNKTHCFEGGAHRPFKNGALCVMLAARVRAAE